MGEQTETQERKVGRLTLKAFIGIIVALVLLGVTIGLCIHFIKPPCDDGGQDVMKYPNYDMACPAGIQAACEDYNPSGGLTDAFLCTTNTKLYGPGTNYAINTNMEFHVHTTITTETTKDGSTSLNQRTVLSQGGIKKAKMLVRNYTLPGVNFDDALSHMTLVMSRWADQASGSTYWLDGCNNTNWQGSDCRIDTDPTVCNSIADNCNASTYFKNITFKNNNETYKPPKSRENYTALTCDISRQDNDNVDPLEGAYGKLGFNGIDAGGGGCGCLTINYNGEDDQYYIIAAWGARDLNGLTGVTPYEGTIVFQGNAPRCYVMKPISEISSSCSDAIMYHPYSENVSEDGPYPISPNKSFTNCGRDFQLFDIRNCELEFDVNLNGTGAACNFAMYFVNMQSMVQKSNPGQCGDYYCDANAKYSVCGSCDDRADGKEYAYCTEIDIFEANQIAIHATPHGCSSEGTQTFDHTDNPLNCTGPNSDVRFALPDGSQDETTTNCDGYGFSGGNAGTGIVSALIPYCTPDKVGCPNGYTCGSSWQYIEGDEPGWGWGLPTSN